MSSPHRYWDMVPDLVSCFGRCTSERKKTYLNSLKSQQILIRTKWPPFCKSHFQIQFLQWSLLYLHSNITEVCSYGSLGEHWFTSCYLNWWWPILARHICVTSYTSRLTSSQACDCWWSNTVTRQSSCKNTGSKCGFPSQRPVTRSFDVSFDLHLNKCLSKQSWGCWFETTSWSLWRHCNDLSMYRLQLRFR